MIKPVTKASARLPLALAIIAAIAIAPAAFAQSQPQSTPLPASPASVSQSTTTQTTPKQKKKPQTASQKNAKQLQTVTVTGSLIQMPENESVAPVQSVNVQEHLATGSFDTANILMGTAIAAGSTEINGQFGGFLVNGGTGVESVNLRGLGPTRTLVLMNGQRPGPAGVRGAVSAFDLNVVPVSIIQRIDIVKDGSSSIYGSDAVAGVVNIITKHEIDHPTLDVRAGVPVHGGGEQYTLAFADGWNVSSGNFVLALQVDRQNALKRGERSFLNCQRDRYWMNGKPYQIPDDSILEGTKYEGCSGLLINTIIGGPTGRLVPTKDGSTGAGSPVAGFMPYTPTGYGPGQSPANDQVDYAPFLNQAYAIQKRQRASLYGAANLQFGDVSWDSLLLYSYRRTDNNGWRQFFPYVILPWHAGSPPALQPDASTVLIPVMPYPANTHVKVNYLYGATKVSGFFAWTQSWTWEANATYSESRGMYDTLAPNIDARVSGDFFGEGTTAFGKPGSVVESPYAPINFLGGPGFLNGADMQTLVDTYALDNLGHTTFKQETANVLFTGDLFDGWAGTAQAAFGAEFRHKALRDVPAEATLDKWLWGATAAGITHGTDNVKEIFTQFGIPLVSDVPGFRKLSLDLSAREFHYNSVGSWSHVWRAGLNWQIIPSLRIRGTLGTSYVAPKLFQLYLADETGFVAQASIDPCDQWGQSNNQFVRANCAAAGIPSDYQANNNPTGTSHAEGGKGNLVPEVSRAKTIGTVWTPGEGSVSISLDYFDYIIRDEITQLGAATIVSGCYARPVYPNHFCDLLKRNAPDAVSNPNMITDVFNQYININTERERGYDLFGTWHNDFSFGTLRADMDIVYQISDLTQLFSATQESGFTTNERIGFIGNPYMVGVFHLSWKRGNWQVSWQGQYFSKTRNKDAPKTFKLFGNGPVVAQDTVAGAQFRQSVSATYSHPKWDFTLGIRNVFDKKPDLVSPNAVGTTLYGNAPLAATQYDYFGRTIFAHLRYNF